MTAALLALALLAGAPDPAAQAEPPGLSSWIPPVSGRLYGVADRFELTPGVGVSLEDPFVQKLIPQLSAGYHFGESFYLGLKLGYALGFSSGVAQSCTAAGTGLSCQGPSAAELASLPGQMTGFGLLEGGWTPLYGKLRLVGDTVLHFDLSLLLGAGVILAGVPAPVGSGATAPTGAAAPALGPGLGEHFFVSDRVAIALELRDYLYDLAGGIQGQLVFNLGVAFLLGGGAQ